MHTGYKFIMEDILGFEEAQNKIKGLAEFKFTDFIYVGTSDLFDNIIPVKKKQQIIIVKSEKHDRRNSGRKESKLF